MKNSKRIFGKILSLFVAVALVTGLIPVAGASVSEEKLKLGVISDIHYYALAYSESTDEFGDWAMGGNKQYINQPGIIESAFALYKSEAQKGNVDYILIPGDLSRNGEYQSHIELAEKLRELEEESGVQVIVINGNHDINNSKAVSYVDGKTPVRKTTPEDFREIYKDFGYDIATSYFTPPEGEKAGMLSYAVSLDGYRIIALDGGKYSSDNTKSGEDEHETAGNYSEALVEWALGQCREANEQGQTIIGLDHWSLVPHYESQDRILQGFTLDNWLQVGEKLADAGMHYMFTGHSHSNDVSENVTDNGQVMWDIQTGSLIEFPHFTRTVEFTNYADGSVEMDYKYHEVDEVLPVAVRDTTEVYEKPYRTTFSFNYAYKGDIAEYAKTLVAPLITNLFADISDQGGLVTYLDGLLGLEKLISKYLGAFTPEAMAFINDLGTQIDERYINDTDYTLSVLNDIIDQLCNMEVSPYSSMSLYDEYGIGSASKKGTFGDAVLVIIENMIMGNEEFTDPFMLDVVDRFENGDLGQQVFEMLYELLVNQLVRDEILSNLYVNVDPVFDELGFPEAGDYTQMFVVALVSVLNTDLNTNGKTSYLDLANGALALLDKLGVLEGGSVNGVLDHLIEEYITESQYEAWGHTFAYIIEDFSSDISPEVGADLDGVLKYSGAVPVSVTEENYRLPGLISVSLGNDTRTQMNVSWYSKYSLENPAIEIIEYTDVPEFSGTASYPQGVSVELTSEKKIREFPGVDLGIIGLFPYELQLNRNIAKISGLEPGKKYLFRVGDSKYGWWSEIGELRTADGSDEVTFLHITDSQGQNEKQYAEFAELYDKALSLYDDTDLVIHSGDLVDEGNNVHYWRYFFGSTQSMQKNPIMPVAGNHEGMGENAIVDNFVLPDSVKQDTVSGYYYSFDYNNVHFIMLNTNDTTDDGLSEVQLKWLKKDAAKSTARWKVVVLHKAVYSNGSHYDDSEVNSMREQFASLMPELGIDIVFQGHDHVYLRTNAMNGNEIVEVTTTEETYKSSVYEVKVDPQGTVYAITGASGCKSYIAKSNTETDKLFPRAEAIVNVDSPVFAGVRVVGDTLYYDAYTVENGEAEKIDSFAIKNTAESGDADNDGSVTLEDVNKILRVATKIDSISSDEIRRYDADGDKHVTVMDARIALKKAAGME